MFNAAKGLPAILCSLVALASAAQEGFWPDFTQAEEPTIYTGFPDTPDLGILESSRGWSRPHQTSHNSSGCYRLISDTCWNSWTIT